MADDWQNIKDMPIGFALGMIKHLKEKENEDKVWQMWLMKYPHMNKDNFISFDDFLRKVYNKNISKRPAEEILEESRRIQEAIRKKKERMVKDGN